MKITSNLKAKNFKTKFHLQKHLLPCFDLSLPVFVIILFSCQFGEMDFHKKTFAIKKPVYNGLQQISI